MSKELILDTRELEAPEPMGLVLQNLINLDETTYIKMIHRIEPLMLYTYLEENNFSHKVLCNNQDIYIYIWNSTFEDKKYLKDLR